MFLLNGNGSELVISECGGFIRLNQHLIRISNIQSGSAKKRIGSKCKNEFGLFAATLSPSCTALINLISICEVYAEDYEIRFNPVKCTLMIFSNLKNVNEYVNIM